MHTINTTTKTLRIEKSLFNILIFNKIEEMLRGLIVFLIVLWILLHVYLTYLEHNCGKQVDRLFGIIPSTLIRGGGNEIF